MYDKWYGFGDPNWTDIKMDEEWKEKGGILQGQWVHPEKYNTSNLLPWSNNKGHKEKARMIKERNAILYDERKRQEDLLKDLDVIRLARKDIRVGNLDLQGNFEELTRLVTNLIHKSGVSYPDGKKAQEFVHW